MAGCYRSVIDDIARDRREIGGIGRMDVVNLRWRGAQWYSEEVKAWWSKVEAISCLPVQRFTGWEDWLLLMEILTQVDASRIEELHFHLPDGFLSGEYIPERYRLGDVVLAARFGFSALKTLVLSGISHTTVRCLGSGSLAKALRSGVLRNLRLLFVYPGACPPEIVEALMEGDVPNLRSLRICINDIISDVDFQTPGFNKLEVLVLEDPAPAVWQSFFRAVQSGKLSNITDFEISMKNRFHDLRNIGDIAQWFSSLKYFSFCDAQYFDENFLLSAFKKAPMTELAWKSLRLSGLNTVTGSELQELVSLVDSGRLPHLDTLNLSRRGLSNLPCESLLSFIQSIARGSLPSLQRLDWTGHEVDDATVKAIVEAYYENSSLTTHIEIDWESVSDPSLRTKLETYRDRNKKLVELVVEKTLGTEKQGQDLRDLIPLTSARVFICGYPEVGKTTLRKTLVEKCPEVEVVRSSTAARKTFIQRFGKRCCCLGTTLANKERASPSEERSLSNEETALPIEGAKLPKQEPRTRGIEVSRIEDRSNGESTTLVLWDLAGQQEYHILHSAFLADRGRLSGKVTTFILVFEASYDLSVKGKLLYWLRMVAFSSPPGVKRHVVIVLNRFEGKVFEEDIDAMPWRDLIEDFVKLFGELDVFVEPFFIDVRNPADVIDLKSHLFDTARDLLKGLQVPRIVFNLQMELQTWSEREENKGLPILTSEAFQKSWKYGPTDTVEDLEIGASILHEIGVIIYLNKSIIVPNPEWFCKKIVGELLLPEAMFKGDNILRKLFKPDGSIEIARFQSYFKKLLVGGTKSDDVISMLDYIGLSYKRRDKHLIVPALILVDDYSTIDWNGMGDEIIGRSLTVGDHEWNNSNQEQKNQEEGMKSFIPAALFRRLQVELAHNENFGGRADGNYRVGKSFLSFNVGRLFVLVQFDVDPSDPTDDRIDILVQIRKDSSIMKVKPVEHICEIMQILGHLCVAICPGLKYVIQCIEPASASKRIEDMSGRKLMFLNEIKDRIIKGEECLSWKTVGGDFVKPETCLSESELNAVVNTVKGKYVACQNDQKAMGIFATDAADDEESSPAESAGDKTLALGSNDQEQLLRRQTDEITAVVHQVGDSTVNRIVRHIDEKVEELKSELWKFRQKYDLLVKEIQAQRALFIADRVSGVPRYIYLSKKETGSWISIRDAFRSTYQLHFLCEARFEGNGDNHGLMHEVKEQEGIELKNPHEWLIKAKPWLLWSLQVAVIVGKTVGNVYLPGIFTLIPDINVLDSGKLAKAVDTAAAQILTEGRDANQVRDGDRGYGTASQPVKLEEKEIAESVVKDLKRELRDAEFAKKTRLRRIMFREPHVSTSNQPQSPVLWICNDCIIKYGNRVIPFN